MQNQRRSLNEWMRIITECRQSGLSAAAWCERNDISVSCFYNAVSRLRKKACEIPAPSGKTNVLDITSAKQPLFLLRNYHAHNAYSILTMRIVRTII